MKVQVQNYTWVASTGVITFTDYASILLQNVLLVVNMTDNIIIYQLNDQNKGGTVSSNTLDLEFDTSGMDNADKLAIFYEDPSLDFWKKEDAVAGSGDSGVPAWAVRRDTPAASAADGDYITLSTDSIGRLRVITGTLTTVTTLSAGLTTATTAYTAGDMLGTLWTFTDVAAINGGGWEIVSATLLSDVNILGPTDLFLFDTAVTQAADNAANSWSDADMATCVGVISFPSPSVSALNSISTVPNLSLFGQCASADDNLYGGMVTRIGHTFFTATDDLHIRLLVRRA